MRSFPYLRIFPLLAPLLIAGCSLAPELTPPRDNVPATWRQSTAIPPQEAITPVRWEDFGSTELDGLITKALHHNTDLAASLARIAQARAAATLAGAGQWPQMDSAGESRRNRTSSGDATRYDTRSQASLSVAYELDLWQSNANAADAAASRLEATQQEHRALELTVISETARLYTGLLALDERAGMAQENLGALQEVLRITQARYETGAASGLELAQQQSTVATGEASLAAIITQREAFFHHLAILTGVAPADFTVAATSLEGLRVPRIAADDPWTLLERRPDIARAEATLRAANLDIGVARAQALPSIGLGLDVAYTASPATQVAGLAASFFAPLFHGGALEAEVERTQAVRSEAEAAYRSVLLTAFREVEDGIRAYEAAQQREGSLATAADAARRAYRITRTRYDAGSVDFQTVLDTQRTLLQTEDAALSARQEHFATAIDLLRALGGAYAGHPAASAL